MVCIASGNRLADADHRIAAPPAVSKLEADLHFLGHDVLARRGMDDQLEVVVHRQLVNPLAQRIGRKADDLQMHAPGPRSVGERDTLEPEGECLGDRDGEHADRSREHQRRNDGSQQRTAMKKFPRRNIGNRGCCGGVRARYQFGMIGIGVFAIGREGDGREHMIVQLAEASLHQYGEAGIGQAGECTPHEQAVCDPHSDRSHEDRRDGPHHGRRLEEPVDEQSDPKRGREHRHDRRHAFDPHIRADSTSHLAQFLPHDAGDVGLESH